MTLQLDIPPYKVLLVDDEENIVRSIARLLIDLETEVEILTANSGAQGLELVREHPDLALILSDQRMPGMSGAEFLGQARLLVPDAVRMVLTGYADMAATMDAINKGGAWRYLTKPWEDDILLRTIGEGLEQYRLVQENRALTALVEKQNRELAEWNGSLKGRVMDQTATIRRQNEELKETNRRVGDSFRQTIAAFSRLVELHSSRLEEHSSNVTKLSVLMAAGLGFTPEGIETLRTAALLHDVGVIGISQEILEKRMSALSREELALFLQHAVRGQAAVDAVEELREPGVLIRHHHERFDGGGFPDGLAGSSIPLGARILAMADYVDRELGEERGEEAVQALLVRMEKELGKSLDPELYPVAQPHIGEIYNSATSRRAEAAEKELRPKQLLEGMTVTRDLYSGSGLLIISRGCVLEAGDIMAVARSYKMDPPAGGIFVSWRASGKETGAKLQSVVTEMELKPERLRIGMLITRNIYSGTGLLLLSEGTVLSAVNIAAVSRYYEIDPPSCGVFVSAA